MASSFSRSSDTTVDFPEPAASAASTPRPRVPGSQPWLWRKIGITTTRVYSFTNSAAQFLKNQAPVGRRGTVDFLGHTRDAPRAEPS